MGIKAEKNHQDLCLHVNLTFSSPLNSINIILTTAVQCQRFPKMTNTLGKKHVVAFNSCNPI